MNQVDHEEEYKYEMPSEEEPSASPQCRICMDADSEANPLISPCKCSGSVKHVHEECLKTWILSQNEDIADIKCELCKTPLKMEIKILNKLNCKQSCSDNATHCIFCPVLISILLMLFFVIYLLIDKYADPSTDSGDKGYTLALILACFFASVVIIVLGIKSCRETCVMTKLQSWKIHSQFFEEESNKNDNAADQTFVINTINTMVLPNRIRVRGRRIPRPSLAPLSLTPIHRNGRTIAYRTREDSSDFRSLNSSINQAQDRYLISDRELELPHRQNRIIPLY